MVQVLRGPEKLSNASVHGRRHVSADVPWNRQLDVLLDKDIGLPNVERFAEALHEAAGVKS